MCSRLLRPHVCERVTRVGTVLRRRHLWDASVSSELWPIWRNNLSYLSICFECNHWFWFARCLLIRYIHICNDPMEVGASQSSCRGVISSVPFERTNVAKMFSQGERTLIPKGDSFMSPNCVKKSDASWGGKLTVILISHSLKMRWWRRGHQPCDFNGNLIWMKVTDMECRKVPDRREALVLKRRWGR